MAFSTYKTFLMHKASGGSDYTKLVDIKSFGDLGGTPETVDVTTLSDKKRKTVPGVEDLETIEFTANYTAADYDACAAVAGVSHEFSVWLGGTESGDVVTPTGSDGKFNMTGVLSVYKNGGGVNEAQDMTISINASEGPNKATT